MAKNVMKIAFIITLLTSGYLCLEVAYTHTEDRPDTCFCDNERKILQCNVKDSSQWGDIISDIKIYIPQMLNVSISGAKIVSLPSAFQYNPNLYYLNLGNNDIHMMLPFAFYGLTELKELYLPKNRLTAIYSYIFNDLTNLETLDLSQNEIHMIAERAFSNMISLKHLTLKGNRLSAIPYNVFQDLTSLKGLDLSLNLLTHIHPVTVHPLSSLRSLHINSNQLQTLHESVFKNLTDLKKVHLQNNPWMCNCGLEWLRSSLIDSESPVFYEHSSKIKCMSPIQFTNIQLYRLTDLSSTCKTPEVLSISNNVEAYVKSNFVLDCLVSGSPQPAVVWKTPKDEYIVHKDNHLWLDPDMVPYDDGKHIKIVPYSHDAHIKALQNGSLAVEKLRNYFTGEFECIAVSPGGRVSAHVNVTLISPVKSIYSMSLYVSAGVAGGCLILAIIIGALKMCINACCCKSNEIYDAKSVSGKSGSLKSNTSSSPKSFRSSPSRRSPFKYYSPGGSPIKYHIPPDDWDDDDDEAYNSEAENRISDLGENIRQTLDEAKRRLQRGVERRVTKMRGQLATIRESGSQYMQHMRESGSHVVLRVRQGVVLGVEQVKYHVQSMKELCWTGDIGQTISTVSIATDIDTDEVTEIVKTHTFV